MSLLPRLPGRAGGAPRGSLHLPQVDGLVLGKLRATHVMSERFWRDLGFGYEREKTGEGNW